MGRMILIILGQKASLPVQWNNPGCLDGQKYAARDMLHSHTVSQLGAWQIVCYSNKVRYFLFLKIVTPT